MKKTLIVSLVLLVAGTMPALAYVSTNQADYSPGSTVVISGNNSDGAGYVAGETVDINIQAPYGAVTGETTVDESGAFSWQFTLPTDDTAGGSYPYTVTGETSGVTQSGNFTDANHPVLQVNGAGTGNGAITGTGTTIDCIVAAGATSGSCTQTFNSNNPSVTLTAAADGGSSFVGWSGGDCSGTGTCSPSGLTGNKTVIETATFNLIAKANQTITVTTHAPASAVYNTTFPVAATADSGLTVAITTSGVCSGSGSGSATITMTSGTGTCTVHYNQAGNGSYNPAPEVTENTTAQKADQATLTTDLPASATYGQAGIAAGKSGGSGTGTVTFSAGASTACSVDTNSGAVTITSGTGTCSITVTKAADDNYNQATSDPVSITINKATADCSSITGYAGAYDGNAHGASGNCFGVGGADLSASVDLGSSFMNVPGGTAHWTFSGGTNYNDQNGSSDSTTITITKAAPTCTITGYTGTYDGDPHGATGSCIGAKDETLEGLDLGATFTNVPGGTADWTFTDVTGNYDDDSGSVAIDISKADATINITGYTGVYDGNAHGASDAATGVKGEDLSGSLNLGSTFTDVPGGTAHWTFTGGTNYNDASGDVSIVITKADATCTVTGYSGTYDGDAHGASGSCTGAKGEPLAGLVLGDSFTDVPGGTANWTFTDVTGNYNDDSGNVAIDISKADATIVVTPYDVTYDGNSHTADGSANGVKGEALPGLDLSGTTHTNAGTYTGDAWTFTDVTGNYNDANGKVDDNIKKADATCHVTGYAVLYNGTSHTATGSCIGVGGSPQNTLNLSGTTHTAGGAYVDPWTFISSTGNYNNQSGTVNDVIIAAQPPLTISNKDFQNGSTIPVKIPSTISGWTAKLYVCAGDTGTFCGITAAAAVSSGGSNTLNQFRFDSTGQQYIYNLSTKLTSAFKNGKIGNKYGLWITIDPVLGTTPFLLATITIK